MNAQRLLAAYSAILTGTVAIALLTGAAPGLPSKAALEEINVQRINIREPDGTLRMTISGEKKMPGFIIAGQEHPQQRQSAGMLFFNAEGTETGGLLFGGRNENGKPRSSGSLTFDRYEQDQVIQILETENGQRRFAGLLISDRPEGRLNMVALEKARGLPPAERRAAFAAANAGEAHRIIVARDSDKNAQVGLNDGHGRTRIMMRVTDEGAASIQFLGARGEVVKTITPD